MAHRHDVHVRHEAKAGRHSGHRTDHHPHVGPIIGLGPRAYARRDTATRSPRARRDDRPARARRNRVALLRRQSGEVFGRDADEVDPILHRAGKYHAPG
jgi:hypothetical protein